MTDALVVYSRWTIGPSGLARMEATRKVLKGDSLRIRKLRTITEAHAKSLEINHRRRVAGKDHTVKPR